MAATRVLQILEPVHSVIQNISPKLVKQGCTLSKRLCASSAPQVSNDFDKHHISSSHQPQQIIDIHPLKESSEDAGNSINEHEEIVKYHRLKTKFDGPLDGNVADANRVSVLASRRIDPAMVNQVFYFDTLAFVKKLETSGFSREQAEGCAQCLVEVVNTTLDHQGRHMVTRPQQEVAVQQLLSEIVSVKKDMTLLQKSEFSSLKTDVEKMNVTLTQVQTHMNDEVVKLKGQFSLDINLERGRAIESHAESEKKLQMIDSKVEREVANLKTTQEQYRNEVFKYSVGAVVTVGTFVVALVRLWH